MFRLPWGSYMEWLLRRAHREQAMSTRNMSPVARPSQGGTPGTCTDVSAPVPCLEARSMPNNSTHSHQVLWEKTASKVPSHTWKHLQTTLVVSGPNLSKPPAGPTVHFYTLNDTFIAVGPFSFYLELSKSAIMLSFLSELSALYYIWPQWVASLTV